MAANADDRALLMYDGDCALCRLWVETWRARTGDRVIYAASEEIAREYPDIPPERYRRTVQLIDVDGRRYEGAAAVFRLLAHVPGRGWMIRLYEAPLIAPVSEWAYRLAARHRPFFLKLSYLLWGRKIEAPRYGLTARIFLQALAVVYFFAFVSLIPQLSGLIGPQGLLPATAYLSGLKTQLGASAYWYAPTLAWFGAHAGTLQFMATAGAVASLLAIGGILTVPCFLTMWVMYLSLAAVGQEFMSFPWDSLLLEAGFLAIFLTPWRWRTKYVSRLEASSLIVWLYRFLLFRVIFTSGVVKLLSDDRAWKSLTALRFQFETQPLPTPLAWFAQYLPAWCLKIAALGTHVLELAVPFLFLLPRRARALAAVVTAVFQLLIIVTGNYAFFNWLTLALCLPLIDDALIERVFPKLKKTEAAVETKPDGLLRRWCLGALGALSITLGSAQIAGFFFWLPSPLLWADAAVAPLRIVSGYGLFPETTTKRQEIVIEGSDDGVTWREYAFRDKPGDVKRAPRFVAPFQPRLDWQMWFAAQGDAGRQVWFTNLMIRLMQGSRPILALFKDNPFPDAPPTYVRATMYVYRFTAADERKADGAWWRRQMKVEYYPAVSLDSFAGEAR